MFEEEDQRESETVNTELLAHRRRLVDEWNAWRARSKKELAEEGIHDRAKETETEEDKEEIEVWVEEVVEQIEEEVEDEDEED